MDLESIHENLTRRQNVGESLNFLGTLLREESWRSNEKVKPLVLLTLGLVKLSEQASLEGLRVLVNFTADSDKNRNFLISDENTSFWTWAETAFSGSFAVAQRIVLLLSQFIHNVKEEDTPRFTLFLARFLHQLAAFVALQEDVSDSAAAVEILAEFPEETLLELSTEEAARFWKKGELAFQEDPDEELLLHFALIFFKMSLSDKLSAVFDPHSVLSLFDKVPESEDAVRTKRYLFAGCGNIFSLSTYNNWAHMEKSIDWSLNKEADPYAAAAVAIDIGNCVRSAEDQDKVITAISEEYGLEKFINVLLRRPFGDLVQYQFVHCLTNILQPKSCDILLNGENEPELRRILKVVLDNAQFYPEIARLAVKFFVKLVRIGFVEGSRDVFEYRQLALPFLASGADSDEVALVLLQVKQAEELLQNEEFGSKLLEALFRVRQHVNAVVLLEQLKTQGVFFHTYAAKLGQSWEKERINSEIAGPFTKFLRSVAGAVSEGVGAFEVVENNTRFVAASALTFFRDLGEDFGDATEVCEEILRTQRAQVEELEE